MRNEEEAKRILIEAITAITGYAPDSDLVTLNRHEGGMTMALADADSPGKLVGINLAPVSYWQELSDEGLWYIVAQEHVSAKFCMLATPIEIEMHQAISTCTSKEERDKTRSDFEINRGVIAIQLQRKLLIDTEALAVLRSLGRSTDGCLEVFERELEEWGKISPKERARARQEFQRVRITHSQALISGDTAEVERIVHAATLAVSSFPKSPSVA